MQNRIENKMSIVNQIQLTLRAGGLRAFIWRTLSYLETRVIITTYRLIPTSVLIEERDAAGIKIIKKQSGDLDSMEILGLFIPKLNQLKPNKHLNAVVPNYLFGAFSLASPIIASGKIQFSPIDEVAYDADIILINLSMINQVTSVYAKTIENMEVVFKNNTYVVLCETGLIECATDADILDNIYADPIYEDNKKGVESYIVENGFNNIVREGTMDQSIINEVKHEYLDRLTNDGFTGKNIIDLGTHIGSFSIQISKYLETNGKVICIEPSPYNVNMIKKNIELNQLNKVIHVQQKAVSAKAGKSILYISSDNTGGNKLGMVEPSSKENIEVDVTTLADIVSEFNGENIDLLKIDVEGSEHSILMPHGDLLKNKVKLIIGETGVSIYGDGIDIITFLQKHDFEVEYEGNASQLIFIAKNIHY